MPTDLLDTTNKSNLKGKVCYFTAIINALLSIATNFVLHISLYCRCHSFCCCLSCDGIFRSRHPHCHGWSSNKWVDEQYGDGASIIENLRTVAVAEHQQHRGGAGHMARERSVLLRVS